MYCDSWSKDMHRCCPISCNQKRLTKNDCNALNGKGTCTYPSESQCPSKLSFERTYINVYGKLSKCKICIMTKKC